MTLRYLGHSSFFLVSEKGVRIVTDPFGDVGLSFPHVEADGVTVSHAHYDHCNVAAVGGAPVIFDRAGEFCLGDVKIKAFECDHDECGGKKRGKNLIFLFDFGSLRLCHLGDLGENFSRRRFPLPEHVDVLLVPVGGNYTIDAEEAEKYVRAIAPKVAIPMHYYVKGLKVDVNPPDDFLRRFEKVEKAREEIVLTGLKEKNGEAADPRGPKIIDLERSLSWKVRN